MIDDVASAMERDDRLRHFLEAPQISAEQKNAVLSKAYEDRAPRLFLRYLQRLVKNRRQMLIPEIANEYRDLVDEVEGRVHAQVTLAKQPDDESARGDRAAADAHVRPAGRAAGPREPEHPWRHHRPRGRPRDGRLGPPSARDSEGKDAGQDREVGRQRGNWNGEILRFAQDDNIVIVIQSRQAKDLAVPVPVS